MNKEINKEPKIFSLMPDNGDKSNFDLTISKKRTMVGRSKVCDIVLPHSDISNIHAVIEITDSGVRIYDMNSTHGTYLNGEKIIASDLQPGDSFELASHNFTLNNYEKNVSPPPLEMLIPTMDNVAYSTPKPSLPQSAPPVHTAFASRVRYPLAKDPRAQFSEYIFEDVDSLYPIFKYDFSKYSVEIIILFNDEILSVDYLGQSNGRCRLVGEHPTSNDIEFAYLGKKDKIDFIEIKGDEIILHPLSLYKCLSLSDDIKEIDGTSPIFLNDDDIIRFEKSNLQIFVRKTAAPPVIASPPILRRDPEFIKYLVLVLFFSISFLSVMSIFTVDEELEKEKIPERLATILYRKKLTLSKKRTITKTPNKPKKIKQKSPSKLKVKKTKTTKVKPVKVKKKNVAKAGNVKSKNKAPAKKATPRKGPKNKVTKVSAKKTSKNRSKSARSSAVSKRKSAVNKKSPGRVDTFKSFNFSSTVKNIMAKGGSTKGIGKASSGSASTANSVSIGGSQSATAERAALNPSVGSLSGVALGKLDSSKGVRGIINKKNVYTAGLPYRRVVLGGMDPDVIRSILIAHLPQFRYCYQKVLDKSDSAFHGVVRLDFIIGASGNVTRASVATSSKGMPIAVKRCVSNVLKGIRFPEPLGGGVVEVKQPFNFYPNVR